MSQRIFLALPISDMLHAPIAEWRKSYQKLPVRWLAPKNLHVTIVPPWEEENVSNVVEALKMVEGTTGAFALQFDRVTYGPNSREPRLIWAEGEAPDQIFALRHAAERALSRTPEGKPFRLHLTLARFKSEDFPNFPVQKIDDAIGWLEPVSSFVLLESHLGASGAEYETLATFQL